MNTDAIPEAPVEGSTYKHNKAYVANWVEIWALGIVIVIGGQFFGWNYGLAAGWGSFFIATILMGTGYICLIVSASETTSALPFAGAFGICRCSMGFYPGFLVGASELLEYVVYVATSCLSLCLMVCTFSGIDVKWSPLLWLLFYSSALFIHISGGRTFWWSSNILAFFSFVILLIFCFGAIRYGNFVGNASSASSDDPSAAIWFSGGFSSFMRVFPLASWWYVGVESLGFAYNAVEDVAKDISRGSNSCVATLFVTSLLVLFVTPSVSPSSAVATALSPLDSGTALVYGIPLEWAGALAIPATYATAFGFIFSYGRLLESLAQSGLFPTVFSRTNSAGQPYVAMLACSLLGYVICLVAFYVPFVALQLFNICVLLAFGCYVCQSYSYYMVYTRFANIQRDYRSPFGLYGAAYAAAVFSLGILAVIFFQGDGGFAIITVIIFQVIFSAWYYLVVVKTQKFSPDEATIMFRAYVINANYLSRASYIRSHRRRDPNENGVSNASLRGVYRAVIRTFSGNLGNLGNLGSAKIYASDKQGQSRSSSDKVSEASDLEGATSVATGTVTGTMAAIKEEASSAVSGMTEGVLIVEDRDEGTSRKLVSLRYDDK